MKRRGHGRPLGTTTRVRMRWGQEFEPQLGEVTLESGTDRYYRVAGVEEHSRDRRPR